jgi:hypothetical protein
MAAETVNTKVQDTTKKDNVVAKQLEEKANSMGNLKAAVSETSAAAAKCDSTMAGTKAARDFSKKLVSDAKEHIKKRVKDLEEKETQLLSAKRKLLLADAALTRRKNISAAIKVLKEQWDTTKKAHTAELTRLKEASTKLKGQLDEAKKLASEAKGVSVGARSAADAENKNTEDKVFDRMAIVRKGGLAKLALLVTMQAKFVAKLVEDAKQRLEVASLGYKPHSANVQAKQLIVENQRTLNHEASKWHNETMATNKRILGFTKESYEEKVSKEGAAQMAVWAQDKVLANIKAVHRLTHIKYESADAHRRKTALEAVNERVLRRWLTHASDEDPVKAQTMERGLLSKVLASWDRDGTPVASSVVDEWYWSEGTKLFASHLGKPGFLSPVVTERCSAACATASEEECGARYGLRDPQACSKGRVFRVRYKRVSSTEAMGDWFLCRCNSGVLQFAGTEKGTWSRSKDGVLRSELKPEGISFETPLHATEMLPDTYVSCFRDFKDWLTKKPAFAQKTDVSAAAMSPESIDMAAASSLDSLALSATSDLPQTYDTVKNMWRQQCMNEPVQADNVKGTEPGSDDSSVDIHMVKQVKDLNPEYDSDRTSVDRDQVDTWAKASAEDKASANPAEEEA